MTRKRAQGKIESLRVHREIGYGRPSDHIRVHVVIELDGNSDLKMGFPLLQDENQMVHEAWMAMLRDAFANNLTVEVLSDHDTEDGNNGVIRDLTLIR